METNELLPFEKAKKFVKKLELKSSNEWREYCQCGKKPKNLPSNPNKAYGNKGWISWGDWLGTGVIANQNMEFLPFEEARELVSKLGLKSLKEWKAYCKSEKRPKNIHSNPDYFYKSEGWISWGDWLGVKPGFNGFLPFEEARNFVSKLGLKSYKEWREYCKSGNKPHNIPQAPAEYYKEKGWSSWGVWLKK